MVRDRDRKSVSLDLPPKMWAALSYWAALTGRTKREVVEEALRLYFEMHEVEKKHGLVIEDEEDR